MCIFHCLGVSIIHITTNQTSSNFAAKITYVFRFNCLVDYTRLVEFKAYSSLGTAWNKSKLFDDPRIKNMAAKYNCSITNFLLAWSINQGISVLPKSINSDHIRENFAAKDVHISKEDIEDVKSDKPDKFCWDPKTII